MQRHFALLISAIVMGAAAFPVAAQEQTAYPRFDGIWETEKGRMALWQAEDAVWGLYGSHGELGGYVDEDGILQFFWEEGPDGYGTGWFRLNDEGDWFDGLWSDDTEIAEHGTWTGELLGPNTFEIGDRDALEYEPGEVPIIDGSESEEAVESSVEAEVPVEEGTPEMPLEPEYQGDSEVAWTGTWEASRGYLVLAADGDTVVGSFGESGVLQGTIEDATLNAVWTEIGEDGTEREGEAIFWLAEDGLSFRGTYNTSEEPDLWLVWSGEKLLEPPGFVVSSEPEEEEVDEEEVEEEEEITERNQ